MTPIATPAPAADDKAKPVPTSKFTAAKEFYVASKHYAEGAEVQLTKSQAERLDGYLAKPA